MEDEQVHDEPLTMSPMPADIKARMIKVQGGRWYLPVASRLIWFRRDHPDWGIVTDPLEINHKDNWAVFRTSIFTADGRLVSTGTKKEDLRGFGDWLEKAETGSVGRALSMLGYSTENDHELAEAVTVDSPSRNVAPPKGTPRPAGPVPPVQRPPVQRSAQPRPPANLPVRDLNADTEEDFPPVEDIPAPPRQRPAPQPSAPDSGTERAGSTLPSPEESAQRQNAFERYGRRAQELGFDVTTSGGNALSYGKVLGVIIQQSQTTPLDNLPPLQRPKTIPSHERWFPEAHFVEYALTDLDRYAAQSGKKNPAERPLRV